MVVSNPNFNLDAATKYRIKNIKKARIKLPAISFMKTHWKSIISQAVAEISNETFIGLQNRGLDLSTQIVNGAQTVALTANNTASALVGTTVNLSYDYNPQGFIDNGGGRAIALLIPIFAALAIVVFAVVMFFNREVFDNLLRRRN